ncbi:putative transposable element, partial [Pseudoloma neurophilia]
KAIIPADGNEESKYQKKKSDQFIAEAHERLGHSGIVRLHETLKRAYVIIGMRKRIESIINNCVNCQMNKNHTHGKLGLLSGSLHHDTAWEKIAVDLFGPSDFAHFSTHSEGVRCIS